MTRPLTIVTLCAALAACSGGTPAHDAGPEDAGPGDAGPDAGQVSDAGQPAFAAELRAAAQSSSLYSMSFGAQSAFLLTIFPVFTGTLSCSSDSLNNASDAPWLLELGTPLASGTYPVGPSNASADPPTGNQALVVLREHIQATFTNAAIEPTEGQVVIGTAPDGGAAQVGGAHVTGSFHLGFPANPLQPPECFFEGGGGFPDGSFTSEGWCVCKDLDGNTVSVCDGGEPAGGCCLPTEPATIFVDGTFDAPPCYLLCADPQTGQCEQLAPDGGAE
jgi:hypothetical protein